MLNMPSPAQIDEAVDLAVRENASRGGSETEMTFKGFVSAIFSTVQGGGAAEGGEGTSTSPL